MEKVNFDKTYTLITGATGGLGQAFVFETIKNNKNLLLTSTSIDKLYPLKEKILAINPSIDVQIFECNFCKMDDLTNLIAFIKDNNLCIDTLINNAGYICEGSTEYTETSTLQKCIQINNQATTFITKNILDMHSSATHLDIITISSMAGNYPLPYMAIYSATKAFLKNYYLALRYEYRKQNVNILVVLPGAIATSDSMKEAIIAQGLKGKLSAVPPEKIARNSLKKVKRNKSTYIPGFFNKLTDFVSKITPQSLQIKVAGKMWRKSQDKRNIK